MFDNGDLNLFDHDSFADGVPHKTFERLRKEDPVSWSEGDGETRGFWNLTRHSDILNANKDGQLFSLRKAYVLRTKAMKSTWHDGLFKKPTCLSTL